MKKKTATLFVLICLLMPIAAQAVQNPCDGVDERTILNHIPLPQSLSIVKKKVISNTCEVVIRVMNEQVPIYVFADYIIAGDLFKDKKHITQQSIEELQTRSFSSLRPDIDAAVAFSYKPSQKTEKYVYMFTDPECQFCELAKYQVRDFAEKKRVEVRVVFFPLPMHDGAKEKAVKGLCSKMDYSRYLDGDYNGSLCKEGEEIINKALNLGESLELNGTPTFIGPDGKRAVGFDAKQLEAIL